MIIELGKYNKIRELLIENRTTGSQGHIHYWDRGWRVSVTRAAVHIDAWLHGWMSETVGFVTCANRRKDLPKTTSGRLHSKPWDHLHKMSLGTVVA